MKTIIETSVRMLGALIALLMGIGAAQASVEISARVTKNMSCSAGVCSPTAKQAVLNVNDLTNMLAAGDVKVTTGAGAVTITIAAPFSWTSASRLTLDAYYNVSFRAAVAVAGQGAVTIVTNDGGSAGDLLFFPGGKLDFWNNGSSLIVNENTFTLVRDIAGLANVIKENRSGLYALAKDYNASKDGFYKSSPIKAHFGGNFEGLGHVIKNLSITAKEARIVGLFGQLNAHGVVRDIGLLRANVTGGNSSSLLGTLVGFNEGTVRNSYATGQVSGTGYIGGLIGAMYSTKFQSVTNSYADCAVKVTMHNADSYAGGLVGRNQYGNIANSSASGDVVGSVVGGLVGSNEGGTITDSHATGAVIHDDVVNSGFLGGLVAMSDYSTIENSYATGVIAAGASNQNETVGGLSGRTEGGIISNSFATGSVAGGKYAGGLVGIASSDILNDYATGAVQADGGAEMGGLVGVHNGATFEYSYSTGAVIGGQQKYSGGLVGRYYDGTAPDSYWDIDTSGKTYSAEGIGLTDPQLKSQLPGGFDPKIWGQKKSINNGYPYLLANPPPQ